MGSRLGTLALVVVAALVTVWSGWSPLPSRAAVEEPPGFSSGGLGITRETWETFVDFESNETVGEYVNYGFASPPAFYYVGYQDEVIRYLEWAWLDGSTTPFAEMQVFAVSLMPIDAVHIDAFDVTTVEPGASGAVRVHLYVSDSLVGQFPNGLGATSNVIVVTYYAAMGAGGLPDAEQITRVSLAIGTGPGDAIPEMS